MRTWKSIFAASLLIALSALAQQTTTVTPAAEQTAPAAAPQSPTVQPQAQPAAIPASRVPATTPAPSTPAPSVAAPTIMDHVVDRAIPRAPALTAMPKTAKPLV